jgi:excisionase family DNA binding protein
MAAPPSPWFTAKDAARYLRHGERFIRGEIAAGRLRAARVGGRGEILTRAEWCDAWVTDRAHTVALPLKRRA